MTSRDEPAAGRPIDAGEAQARMDGRITIDQAFRRAHARLAAAGVGTPALDARLLVCAAAGIDHERLILEPDRLMGYGEMGAVETMIARRLAAEPVSRIIGEREFWGRRFVVTPATLDPRPDSETVVEAAVEWLRGRGQERPIVIDLGTGTGCLLISILGEIPGAWGIGTDIDPVALTVAANNARRHLGLGRAGFVCGDWLAPIFGRASVIVANPPYIPRQEIACLAPEVARFEPRRALDGGQDGLEGYRRILADSAAHLDADGLLALEIGDGQAEAVAGIIEENRMRVAERRCDLAGRTRCICATPVT